MLHKVLTSATIFRVCAYCLPLVCKSGWFILIFNKGWFSFAICNVYVAKQFIRQYFEIGTNWSVYINPSNVSVVIQYIGLHVRDVHVSKNI